MHCGPHVGRMQVAGNAVLSALGSGQQWRMALALSETEAWEGLKRAMGIYGISMGILLDPCFIRRLYVEGSLDFFSLRCSNMFKACHIQRVSSYECQHCASDTHRRS